jgi:hypothetical protein
MLRLDCENSQARPAGAKRGFQMDDRIEAFIRDILRLEGANSNAVREGVRIHLAQYEKVFRDAEPDKRRKDAAAERCRKLCCDRVLKEIQLRTAPSTVEHLQIVLSAIDSPARFPLKE